FGRELTVRLNGLDYERLPDADVYANLTVHQPLRHCYDRGLTRLHLGTGSYDAKCRRGASVRPLWAVAGGAQPGTDGSRERLAVLTAQMPRREAALFGAEVTARLAEADAV
ncbi:hypothetical protein AB0D01_39665, partial [Streptomyces sp. NPDC048606]